jgi:hypothetical protein
MKTKALSQARAISFLTLLSLDSIPLKDLRRISPDWVLWLQDYYKGQGKIKLENIPFYINLRQFESVFKKILVKDDLPNFSIHLSSVEEIDGYYAESDFLYIPADANELYLYNSSVKNNSNYLPKYIIRKLKLIPKNITVILIKYGGRVKVLTYLINKECSEQNFSESDVIIHKFCMDFDLEKAQVFRCKSGQKVQKGFVLDVGGNVLGMRWVR